jgi:hypothetical protein
VATQEQKKDYHVTKDFSGVNTKANRTAIKEDEFAWLENAMPIGHGNIRVVPGPSTVTGITFSASVSYAAYANIGTTNYYLAFMSDGGLEVVNLTTNIKSTVAAAATFSTSGVASSNWNNSTVLIIDPVKGYFQWNGTTLVSVGSLSFVLNGYFSTLSGVAITGAAGTFSCTASTTTLVVGQAVVISGIFAGTGSITGYTNPSSYYIILTNGSTTFTLSATKGGAAIATTAGTPTGLTYSFTGTGYASPVTAAVAAPSAGGTQAVISLSTNGTSITGVSAYGTGLSTGTNYLTAPAVTIGGAGVGQSVTASVFSQPGTAIASFSKRVWIANGRTLYFTAAGTNNDFYSTSAGNIIFDDSTLVGNITQIISANNFLYVFGIDSINVISDVRVDNTGTTLYTNTNISAAVGTDLPYAMMAYFRSIVFMNRYGVYALVGSTTSKLSDALDGMFPYIDFTKTISAGQVLIYNILCAAFSFTYNDPLSSARVIQAVYFDKKWFFTSQGTFTYVIQVPTNGAAVLYATTGTNLQKTYQDNTVAINSKVQTSLLGMGDIIRDKQALKFGVEAILSSSFGNNLSITVDSESGSSPATTLNNFTVVTWQNNTLVTVSWINNALANVSWGNSTTGYYLYRYDAQQWGKYIGLTITSTSPNFIISGFQYETEKRARF